MMAVTSFAMKGIDTSFTATFSPKYAERERVRRATS
jgi:hypothetical protein